MVENPVSTAMRHSKNTIMSSLAGATDNPGPFLSWRTPGTSRGFSLYSARIVLFVTALLASAITSADCVKDSRGEVYCGAGRCIIDSEGTVWCSRHYDGDAQITLDGRVLCGKGQCARGGNGRVFCSSEVGGAVLIDSRGNVRCYGQCEPATADKCENTRADGADS